MGDKPFDEAQGHVHFSANCFNRTWELIDKSDRTPAEDEQMLLRAMSSAWHWSQRPDLQPTNLSVGYWLISRVHAILGRADEARRYGRLSLEAASREGVGPFYRGYALEALARAETVAGRSAQANRHAAEAKQIAAEIEDDDSRAMLLGDLENLA
jgi:hypothetical protein